MNMQRPRFMRRRGRLRHLPIIVVLALILAGTACSGSKQKKADKTAAEQQRSAAKAQDAKEQVEEPSAEELAKSPCGNPQWAKLPEGTEEQEEDAEEQGENAPDSSNSDEEPEEDALQDSERPSDDEQTSDPGDC